MKGFIRLAAAGALILSLSVPVYADKSAKTELPARTKRRKSHPPDRHSRIFWNISFSRAIPMNKAASDSGRSGRSVADRI